MKFDINKIKDRLRLIVRAVEKGVGEDIREYLRSTDTDTTNAIRFLRSDYINTNLRDSVASDTVELKHFNRSAWTGCLLIDRQNKFTYTICAKQTLEAIPKKKNRQIPHYLQTILYIQNADVEATQHQLSLADYMPELFTSFSDEEFRDDYQKIMDEEISFDDDYIHLVIVYETERMVITSIAVKLLDPDFQTAQEYSLMEMLKPDFSDLTASVDSRDKEQPKQDSHSLVSVKAGLKKTETTTPETVVTPKRSEEEKQA